MKSSGIILLLVAIVLLVIFIYLVSIFIRKRNDVLITKLESKKQELFSLPIADEIDEVKELQLIGQSQIAFREWSQKWMDLSLNSFPDIENHIVEAGNWNNTFHFLKVKQAIDSVDSQLKLINEDIQSIREALDILKEQEEKNSARVTHALDLYEKLKDSVSQNESQYGSTLPEIQKQLKNIEIEFSQFVTLNSTGDPVEASEILDRAEEHTIALGQITEQIPAIVVTLENDLPSQLDDLESGYRQLLEQQYNFSDKNIESQFQTIREAIRTNSSDLVSLDLDHARIENEDIQGKIDYLYQLFEIEINAYKSVVKSSKVIPKYLEHSKQNNQKLHQELDRLSLKYLMPNVENLSLEAFTRDLTQIEELVLPKVQNFKEIDKPFSEIAANFKEELNRLKKIEDGQLEIFEEIKTIEDTESNARNKANLYVNQLHMIKRYMEKKNLPGIPQDFLSLFFTTSSQLEALMEELSKGKINIETVSRLLEVSTASISNLEEESYRIIQDSILTEQLLQYSNRYRSFEPHIQSSFEHALRLFEVDYNYKASFDEISQALEVIEPGVTERFKSSYEKTRETILF